MTVRKALSLTLIYALTVTSVPTVLAAPQPNYAVQGTAANEAKKPYTGYQVMLRDMTTMQVVSTKSLDANGNFSFTQLAADKKYQVELFSIADTKIVCTEGPYTLTPTTSIKNDVNINCGRNPLGYILAAAGAAAAAIALGVRSASQ